MKGHPTKEVTQLIHEIKNGYAQFKNIDEKL